MLKNLLVMINCNIFRYFVKLGKLKVKRKNIQKFRKSLILKHFDLIQVMSARTPSSFKAKYFETVFKCPEPELEAEIKSRLCLPVSPQVCNGFKQIMPVKLVF